MDNLAQPFKAIELYEMFMHIIETVQRVWYFLSTDFKEISRDAVETFDFLPDWVLDFIYDYVFSWTGNFSILDLCFGSGLVLVLVITVVRFVKS